VHKTNSCVATHHDMTSFNVNCQSVKDNTREHEEQVEIQEIFEMETGLTSQKVALQRINSQQHDTL